MGMLEDMEGVADSWIGCLGLVYWNCTMAGTNSK